LQLPVVPGHQDTRRKPCNTPRRDKFFFKKTGTSFVAESASVKQKNKDTILEYITMNIAFNASLSPQVLA